MDYKTIESFFDSESNLEGILEKCAEVFDKIDMISTSLRNSNIQTGEEIKTIIKELSGLYGFLNPIYKIATTEKLNRETREYTKIRIDIENEGKKFVSASAEREASEAVSNYRRIRNIIESYIEVCKTQIGVCQSLLKSFKDDESNEGQ